MQTRRDGRLLEAAIKRALADSGLVRSVLELSRVTGIRPGTMYDWFSGRRVPRTDSLARVAAALDTPLARLLDAYEGRAPEPGPSEATLAAIEQAVERGVEAALRRLLEEGALAGPRSGEG
jgi:transcriptional regulator with XRE-family HTH domain